MNHSQLAYKYFLEGYNCAQSVVLAFSDILDIDKDKLIALSSCFGAGVSRLREVCGVISGASIVLGLLYGNYDINDVNAKGNHYKMIQDISFKFKEKYGSYKCHELLHLDNYPSNPIPLKRDANYYASRPCGNYIAYMASLIEKVIENHGKD